MDRPQPTELIPTSSHRHVHPSRSLAGIALVAVLLLSSCAGDGDGETGLATAKGVSRNLCRALEDLATDVEKSDDIKADLPALKARGEAILEVLPEDAPKVATDFFAAFVELTELGPIWENDKGGIKVEYVDDFTRLLTATTDEARDDTEAYLRAQCPATSERPGGGLSELFRGGAGPVRRPADRVGSPTTVAPKPAEMRTVLADGPKGTYEQVTVDVAKVTATNADSAGAFGDDPVAGAATFLLVEVELSTAQSGGNRFSAEDFRLVDPSGKAVTAESVVDRTGNFAQLALRGRDSTSGTLVFPTASLVTNVGKYALHIDRDGRVPAVLALSGPATSPYPVGLEPGATGAFEVKVAGGCFDRYQTVVRSIAADLDADLGTPRDIDRVARGQRWIRVALDVTNVSSCPAVQAFSGNFAGVELRIDANGRLTASDARKSFDRIEPGTTSERVEIFAVDAKATSLVLTAPGGEVLGRWSIQLPAAPGEA